MHDYLTSEIYKSFRNGVVIKDNDSAEHAYRYFKKEFSNTGILLELRGRSYHVKPAVQRKLDKIQKVKTIRRQIAMANRQMNHF